MFREVFRHRLRDYTFGTKRRSVTLHSLTFSLAIEPARLVSPRVSRSDPRRGGDSLAISPRGGVIGAARSTTDSGRDTAGGCASSFDTSRFVRAENPDSGIPRPVDIKVTDVPEVVPVASDDFGWRFLV